MLVENRSKKTEPASASDEVAGKLQRESANPTGKSANSTGAAALPAGNVRRGGAEAAEPAEVSEPAVVNAIQPAAEPFRQVRARGRSGPTSAAGKARVAQNALKHGLRSEKVVLPGENPEAYRAVQAKVFAELRPEGEIEAFLAWRVATAIWRLSRLLGVEAELFCKGGFAAYLEPAGPGEAFFEGSRQGDVFTKLSRYEAEIDRSLFKAFHELQRLQAARNGGAVPLPLAVDVNLSGPQGN